MSSNQFQAVCDLLTTAAWVTSIEEAVSHVGDLMPGCGAQELESLVTRHAKGVTFPCLVHVDDEVGIPVFVSSSTIRLLQDRLLLTLPGDPISKAMQVSGREHATQEDKGCNAYVKHPLAVASAVMASGGTDVQIAAALMHDVVEDTEETLDRLRYVAGFDDEVVDVVDAVSRRPEESPDQYLDRLVLDKDAVVVKKADIQHNMDLRRLNRAPEEGDLRRNQVYAKELKRLEEVPNV